MTKFVGRGTVQITGRNVGKSHWTNVAIDRLMKDLMSQPVSDLILNEGTVYGSRYLTIEPIGGNWLEMETWCREAFGPSAEIIWGNDFNRVPKEYERWYMNNRKFWFRDEKDRDWFVLRWNS